ncbi:hypothetical protein BD770DRAFT_408564 [Pilaira anomala]|nr:hypothetical protein BD770DRAFT_408564 [Pilaira anomala]
MSTSLLTASDGSIIIWGFMFENTLFTEFERRNHAIIENAYRQRKKKHSSHHINIADANLPDPGKAKLYFGVAQNHLRMPGTRYYVIRHVLKQSPSSPPFSSPISMSSPSSASTSSTFSSLDTSFAGRSRSQFRSVSPQLQHASNQQRKRQQGQTSSGHQQKKQKLVFANQYQPSVVSNQSQQQQVTSNHYQQDQSVPNYYQQNQEIVPIDYQQEQAISSNYQQLVSSNYQPFVSNNYQQDQQFNSETLAQVLSNDMSLINVDQNACVDSMMNFGQPPMVYYDGFFPDFSALNITENPTWLNDDLLFSWSSPPPVEAFDCNQLDLTNQLYI